MAYCPNCRLVYEDGLEKCPDDGFTLAPEPHSLGSKEIELPAGSLIGDYTILEKIGTGTFGDVYRAEQVMIGRKVALKVLRRKYCADPLVVSRFIAEARAVNQIRHRHIIDIYTFGQLPDGRHYHVMDLLEGVTLDRYLKARGRLPPDQVLAILEPLARALDAAHASGIAHRDLKPANVFLALDDEKKPLPKLLDFGMAKLLTDDLPRDHETATGATIGTPGYMSPEQCRGPDVDHRTDIYAFGVMTYELLTGRRPFEGEAAIQIMMKHLMEAPDPPSSRVAELPAVLDAPILAMLEKERERRPPNLSTALRSLQTALAGEGSSQTFTPVSLPPIAFDPAEMTNAPTVATLPSAQQPAPVRPRGRAWIAAVAGATAAILAVAAVTRSEQPVASPVANAEPPLPAAVSIEPPVTPPRVRIPVRGTPANAELVAADGKVRVAVGGTLELDEQHAPLELIASKPGFLSERILVDPRRDKEIVVHLKKVRSNGTKAPAERENAPEVLPDLPVRF